MCTSYLKEIYNFYLQLHQWARKVQAYGLQMVPIPNDPLALPYSDKSDPLRGPIFVPLNIDCLDPNSILFKGNPSSNKLGGNNIYFYFRISR